MDCFLTSAQVSLYFSTHTFGKERKRKDYTFQRHFNEVSLCICTHTFGKGRKRKTTPFSVTSMRCLSTSVLIPLEKEGKKKTTPFSVTSMRSQLHRAAQGIPRVFPGYSYLYLTLYYSTAEKDSLARPDLCHTHLVFAGVWNHYHKIHHKLITTKKQEFWQLTSSLLA